MNLDYPQPIDGLRMDLEKISPQLCELYFATHEPSELKQARATYQIGIEQEGPCVDLLVVETMALGVKVQHTRAFKRNDQRVWSERLHVDCERGDEDESTERE